MAWYLTPTGRPKLAADADVPRLLERGYRVIDDVEVPAARQAWENDEFYIPTAPTTGSGTPSPEAIAAALPARLSDTALRAAFGRLPAHAGTRPGRYDPTRSTYNLHAGNTRRMRAALGAARAGAGLCRVTFLGDSLTAGHGTTRGTQDAVTQLRAELGRRGHPVGEQVTPATGGLPDPRLTFTVHGFDLPYSLAYAEIAPGATFTVRGEGTVFDAVLTDASGTLTLSVDDGEAQVLRADSGDTGTQLVIATRTGLTAGAHTGVLTNTGTRPAFLFSAGYRPEAGIVLTNAGLSGATVSTWLTGPTWGTDNSYSPAWSLFHPGNVDHDVVFVELGMNDRWQSVPPATFRTRLGELINRARARGATVVLTVSNSPDGADTSPTWGTFAAAVYDVADSRDVPLLDLTDRWGPFSAYNADGLARDMATDEVHLTAAGNAAKAFAWADVLGL